MKILICTGIYPPDIGGPATYSKLLFDELPKRSIEVEVLSFGEVRYLPKVIRHLVYFMKVIKKGKDVDLIYAQDPVSVGLPSVLASKILRKRFMLKIVGDYAWEQQQQKAGVEYVSPEEFQDRKFDFVTETRRKIERWVARQTNHVVVPSEYLKRIVKMWGVDENKITVIYNAFAPKNTLDDKENLRKQFSFNETIVFSVGRLVPWKGFGILVEIMKDFPNMRLFIAGDGPDKDKLEEKIKDLDLNERVVLLGRLQQDVLLKYIKASDIFVLNTGYEGLSHQLLEVMSVGTPIVTTNIGGNPETIESGKEGLLVEYDNKEQIKNAMVKILENNDLKLRIIRNAKQKVQKFSVQNTLDELEKLIR